MAEEYEEQELIEEAQQAERLAIAYEIEEASRLSKKKQPEKFPDVYEKELVRKPEPIDDWEKELLDVLYDNAPMVITIDVPGIPAINVAARLWHICNSITVSPTILTGVNTTIEHSLTGEDLGGAAWRALAVSGPAQIILCLGSNRLATWSEQALRRSNIRLVVQAITIRRY